MQKGHYQLVEKAFVPLFLRKLNFFRQAYLLFSDKPNNKFGAERVTSCLQRTEACKAEISPSASLKPAKVSS